MSNIDRETIKDVIFSAAKSFNTTQDPNSQIVLDEATVLIGQGAAIDSMGLVSLLIEIEQQLQEKLQLSVNFTSEKAMAARVSPFRRIRTVIEFICDKLPDLL